MRENEAADTLAARGYRVEQNPPTRPNGSNPHYRIEGEYFDCYAPSASTSPRNIWTNLKTEKVGRQADRMVLNLDDWRGDTDALRKQFADWPLPDLQEVVAVQGGQVVHLYP